MRALLLTLLSTLSLPASAGATFTLDDLRGDDHGAGGLIYPNRDDLSPGDLDLVSFSARSGDGGTWFRVEFARPVRNPRGVVTQVGQNPVQNIARHGFYTFNVDVYIDTDRVAGSGKTDAIPGRGIAVDREFAWERAVVLTPRPEVARTMLEGQLLEEAEEEMRARDGRVSKGRLEHRAGRLKAELDALYAFSSRINVAGRAVEFFVDDAFLGGPASPSWGYTVIVTGADIERSGPPAAGTRRRAPMFTMGVARGITYDSFGIRADEDAGLSPVVDILAGSPGVQERALSEYDAVAARLASVPGVAPDGRPARVPAGAAVSAAAAARVEAVTRPGGAAAAPPAGQATPGAAARPGGGSQPRTVAQRLRELNQLLEDGLITAEEHAELRRRILAEL
jgi:hypothetical protein